MEDIPSATKDPPDTASDPDVKLKEPPSTPDPADNNTDPPLLSDVPLLDPTDKEMSPDDPDDALPVLMETDPDPPTDKLANDCNDTEPLDPAALDPPDNIKDPPDEPITAVDPPDK